LKLYPFLGPGFRRGVAPRRGAWIETDDVRHERLVAWSPPAGGRGLKPGF